MGKEGRLYCHLRERVLKGRGRQRGGRSHVGSTGTLYHTREENLCHTVFDIKDTISRGVDNRKNMEFKR